MALLLEVQVSKQDFFDRVLPEAIDLMCNFMEGKIRFIVEETPFFEENFLVKEGFIELDRFVGLFGVVGLTWMCSKTFRVWK